MQNGSFVQIKVSKVPYIPETWNSSPASRAKETVERLSLFLYKENHALDAWFDKAYGDEQKSLLRL